MTIPSPDDLMKSSTGAPSFKFERHGDLVKGKVVDVASGQQFDMKTNAPLFWDDGNPRTQLIITLQTDLRDAQIEDDDGQRRIFAKKPSQMLRAINDAFQKAGGRTITERGATLAVKYVSDEPSSRPGLSPAKVYVAQYLPAPAGADDLLSSATPATNGHAQAAPFDTHHERAAQPVQPALTADDLI